MAKSRQAVYLRRKSLAFLREISAHLPIIVEDGGTAWLLRDQTTSVELFRGRYEVVLAYLSGFAAGTDRGATAPTQRGSCS